MIAKRILARLAVATGVLVSSWALAAPAQAAGEVSFRISNIPSSFVAGAAAKSFDATMTNRSNTPLPFVRRVFTIELPGLTANEVVMVKVVNNQVVALPIASAGQGRVQITDDVPPATLTRRGSVKARYRLAFAAKAPAGHATIVLQGFDTAGQPLGTSTPRGITVKSATTASPTPTKSHTSPTPTVSEAPSAAPTDLAVVPPVDDTPFGATPASESGGLGWPLYTLGTLLVLGGGGLIYWVWRRPAGADDDDEGAEYALHQPTTLLPTHQPTAALPTVLPSAQPPRHRAPAPQPPQQEQPPQRPPWRS